jgi:hypothetical protein
VTIKAESWSKVNSLGNEPTQPSDCEEQGISAANAPTLCLPRGLSLPKLRVPEQSPQRVKTASRAFGCKMTNMPDEENATLVIKTGIEQVFVPFHKLFDQLLGPAAEEVGLMLQDETKVWRFRRRLRLVKEVQRLVDESGLKVNPVATRLFFPVLDAASIEDDDDMQTRWAALIANEATKIGSVHPSFIEILRQMSPDDARLLDRLYDHCLARLTRVATPWVESITLAEIDRRVGAGENPYTPFNNLVRLGLIETVYTIDSKKVKIRTQGRSSKFGTSSKFEGKLDHHYELSDIAYLFVVACRAPKPSEPSSSPHARTPADPARNFQ